MTSAVRDGRRLITAVFGSSSALARATDTEKLLTYGFRFYDNQTFEKALQPLSNPRVWKGVENTVAVGVLDDITLTAPKRSHKPETRIHINTPLIAPVAEGAVVGSIEVFDGDQKLATRPLIALKGVEAGGWWTRWTDAVRLLFQGWFKDIGTD